MRGIISMCTPADLHLVCEECGQEHPCPCDADFYDGSMREFRWLYNISDDVPDADIQEQYAAWAEELEEDFFDQGWDELYDYERE